MIDPDLFSTVQVVEDIAISSIDAHAEYLGWDGKLGDVLLSLQLALHVLLTIGLVQDVHLFYLAFTDDAKIVAVFLRAIGLTKSPSALRPNFHSLLTLASEKEIIC